jgi:hypothetical protein
MHAGTISRGTAQRTVALEPAEKGTTTRLYWYVFHITRLVRIQQRAQLQLTPLAAVHDRLDGSQTEPNLNSSDYNKLWERRVQDQRQQAEKK